MRLIFSYYFENVDFTTFLPLYSVSFSIKSHETNLRLNETKSIFNYKVQVDVFLSYITPVTFLILAQSLNTVALDMSSSAITCSTDK